MSEMSDGMRLGVALCESLGLNPQAVTKITIMIEAGSCGRIAITGPLVKGVEEAVTKVWRGVKWEPVEEADD